MVTEYEIGFAKLIEFDNENHKAHTFERGLNLGSNTIRPIHSREV